MIAVFVEDGPLEVAEDIDEANRSYEGIDVESGVFVFYDEQGRYLRPDFVEPNRSGRYLGLIPWCVSGRFELRAEPDAKEASFEQALDEVSRISPNRWFRSVREVRDHLDDRRAASTDGEEAS